MRRSSNLVPRALFPKCGKGKRPGDEVDDRAAGRESRGLLVFTPNLHNYYISARAKDLWKKGLVSRLLAPTPRGAQARET